MTIPCQKYVCSLIALQSKQAGLNNVCSELSSRRYRVFLLLCRNLTDTSTNLNHNHRGSESTCWGLRFQRRWGTSSRWGWWRRQRCRRPSGSWLQSGLWSPGWGSVSAGTRTFEKQLWKRQVELYWANDGSKEEKNCVEQLQWMFWFVAFASCDKSESWFSFLFCFCVIFCIFFVILCFQCVASTVTFFWRVRSPNPPMRGYLEGTQSID